MRQQAGSADISLISLSGTSGSAASTAAEIAVAVLDLDQAERG
jgi:hypothetical protein